MRVDARYRTSHSASRDKRRTIAAATAAEALGDVKHGCEIFGLTMGQFSLIDIVEHCLRATGPADVTVATWTVAGADMGFAMSLIASGQIRSMRLLVDHSFQRRQPGYCAAMRERFGDAAIRAVKTHAKFVTITNAAWAIAIRSSMNLNENRRLEWYEISDDREMCDYLNEVTEYLFAEFEPGEQFAAGPRRDERDFATLKALDRTPDMLGNGELDADVRRAGWCTSDGGKIE